MELVYQEASLEVPTVLLQCFLFHCLNCGKFSLNWTRGRFSLVAVALPMCVVCCVFFPLNLNPFWGLSMSLRSQDQFPGLSLVDPPLFRSSPLGRPRGGGAAFWRRRSRRLGGVGASVLAAAETPPIAAEEHGKSQLLWEPSTSTPWYIFSSTAKYFAPGGKKSTTKQLFWGEGLWVNPCITRIMLCDLVRWSMHYFSDRCNLINECGDHSMLRGRNLLQPERMCNVQCAVWI